MFEDDFYGYEQAITPFDRKRNLPMIYELNDTKQLILKNFNTGNGVTIIGSEEAIMLFMNAALSDGMYNVNAVGFYPFVNEMRD